jgi:hypothetical protein
MAKNASFPKKTSIASSSANAKSTLKSKSATVLIKAPKAAVGKTGSIKGLKQRDAKTIAASAVQQRPTTKPKNITSAQAKTIIGAYLSAVRTAASKKK